MRLLRCPACNLRMPLRGGQDYMNDYQAIEFHSLSHNPRVVGAWPDVDVLSPAYQRLPGYRCFHPTCQNTFKELSDIPRGWTVTARMVENLATHNYALSYLCRCPVHPEGAPGNEAFAQRLGRIMAAEQGVGDWINEKPTIVCTHVHDNCLNPDAVAVKWFECSLCGRTRSVTVSTEVW